MIVRGTTPHYTFILPLFEADIIQGYITFSQDKVTTFSKSFDAGDILKLEDHCELDTVLNQEETFEFKYYGVPSKDLVNIQIKLITSAGDVCASDIMRESVGRALYEGML